MITRITIPQAFENMEETTIGVWLKQVGESVSVGDALCDLITEKTTFALEAEASGILRLITAAEKSVVPVGAVIGVLAGADDDLSGVAEQIEVENATLREREGATGPVASDAPAVSAVQVPRINLAQLAGTPNAAPGTRLRATPAARRIARELGVDIEAVATALPGKVLSEDDVRNYKA